MPALRKVTAAQRLEIRRRRAAGESLESIGGRVGLPHQTVSRIDREERVRQAVREAQAAAEREAEQRLRRVWADWRVSFDPSSGGPLYPNADCRVDYWAARQNTYEGRLNFNDVCLFHKLLPVEERAMANGRELFLYPPDADALGPDRAGTVPAPRAA